MNGKRCCATRLSSDFVFRHLRKCSEFAHEVLTVCVRACRRVLLGLAMPGPGKTTMAFRGPIGGRKSESTHGRD